MFICAPIAYSDVKGYGKALLRTKLTKACFAGRLRVATIKCLTLKKDMSMTESLWYMTSFVTSSTLNWLIHALCSCEDRSLANRFFLNQLMHLDLYLLLSTSIFLVQLLVTRHKDK